MALILTSSAHRRGGGARWALPFACCGTALVCGLPALMVLWMAMTGEAALSDAPFLWDSVAGTLGLIVVGGGLAALLGASAAWLVSMCAFPGRSVMSWALILPLAAPAYVLAYAYSALTWAGGPIPWPISGFWGAAFIYALAFYPYVYLAARAAFASQSVCALEAARSLGASPWRMMMAVATPLAWPGVAAGLALAAMEIAGDYGVAQYFGATTITTGVFRAWFSRADPLLALEMASLLLIGAAVFLGLERFVRGRRGFAGGSTRWRPLPRYTLSPLAGAGALLFCAGLVTLAALLPLGWLVRMAAMRPLSELPLLGEPLINTVALAGAAALVTLPLAAVLAAGARQSAPRVRWVGQGALFAAAMGYAAPGAVIALGALAAFASLRDSGFVGGLTGTTALFALIWTYAARFAAPGAQPIEAGLARVSPSLGHAARSLGARPLRRFFQVDAPLAAPSVAAAALIVFVEAMKELPATLILRPFDFDTLAVRAFAYAADERLQQAAAPALLIVAVGLIPVVVLSARIERSRAGAE
jgi:iron(III) transport system permease protein